MLLPAHVLASNYVVSGYHASHQDPSTAGAAAKQDMGDFVSITAIQASTVIVSLRPNQTLLPGPDAHVVAGQPVVLSLSLGQVVQLFTPGVSPDDTFSGAEISGGGSPLQLLTGVGCASIPADVATCGHVEDTVYPLDSLGKEYIVPVLHDPTGAAIGNTIRVQSISDGTAITFEPAMMTGVTLGHGEVVELPNVTVDVRISSTVPFAVTQYTKTRTKVADNGLSASGPTQITAASTSQFAMKHSFAASPHFDASFVTIIAPTGASVTLDQKLVSSDLFIAVGATGMSVSRTEVTDNAHVHTIIADKPVGVVVYGFAPYASYGYTGALDLARRAGD